MSIKYQAMSHLGIIDVNNHILSTKIMIKK